MKNKKVNIGVLLGVVTIVFMNLFFFGNFFIIEKGTSKGGIQTMIGVGIILIVMFLISFIIVRKSKNKNL